MPSVKTFISDRDKVTSIFKKEPKKKTKKAQQTGVVPSPGDNLNAHVSNIKEIISEHGKRINEDRRVLEMWMNVLAKGDTNGFVDHPDRWTDKEWQSYVSREKRATNEIMLLTRKT